MFESDRGHGKYVSVCDILCIVETLLERVGEDAAPSLTQIPIHTVNQAFHLMMEGTLRHISLGRYNGEASSLCHSKRAQTFFTQLLCFGTEFNSCNRSRREKIKAIGFR